MKRVAFVAVFSFFAVAVALNVYSDQAASKKNTAKPTASKQSLSARPTAAGDSVIEARYAWYLFLQAMAPANDPGGLLTFENWTEQCQLNPNMIGCPTPVTGNARMLHGSALRRSMTAANAAPTLKSLCNPMTYPSLNGYPAPSNVVPPVNGVPVATFCEEVFVNPAEQAFVTTNSLTTLSGQQTYGNAHGGGITFPWQAVEIKADWVPQSSYTSSNNFTCPDTTLYTETINGVCYALASVHISSKVLPNWLWATFEPNSSVTNPNRCDPNLYSKCFDPWGTTSGQPYGKGQPVPPQSTQLKQAMAAAGLNKVFSNYYLTGVQTLFVGNGKAVPLGNSFTEFNAGVNPGQASCITCHRYAYFDGNQPQLPLCPQPNPQGQCVAPTMPPEDNFGGPPNGWTDLGYACYQNPHASNCTPPVPKSTSQDFSWMLGLMPYK